jgi:hypothetical protein
VYRAQGKLAESEPLFLESLAMLRRLYGNLDHKDLAATIEPI